MKKKIICWDSSVLISHLGGDRGKNPERKGIISPVVSIIENGSHKLLVSALLYTEILECKMPGGAITKLDKFLQNRSHVKVMAVYAKVAKKAQSIRNKKLSVKTPDAIHLATAIVGKAYVFHTFDKGLLRLSGQSVVEGLAITPCRVPGYR